MIFLVLMTLLSGSLSNLTLINTLSYNVGGVPINILDALLLLGLIRAIFVRSPPQYYSPSGNTFLTVTLVLFGLAAVGGTYRWLAGPYFIDSVWFMRCLRHYCTLPIAIFLGYALIRTPKAAGWYIASNVIAGIASAILIFVFFRDKAESLGGAEVHDVNMLRTVQYNVGYSGVVVGLLLFIMFNRLGYLKKSVAWSIIFVCAGGVFMTLTRSDWLATVAGALPAFFLAPPRERVRRVVQAMGAVVLLAVVVFGLLSLGGKLLGNDMGEKMAARLATVNPFAEQDPTHLKAWDTRLPGMKQEIEIWSGNPILGQGFGVQYAYLVTVPGAASMRHNAYTSILSEAGLLGLLPAVLMFVGMIVFGLKLVRARADRISMLVGGFALVVACYQALLGMETMCWNNEREALIPALTFGVLMRMVQIQKAPAAAHTEYLLEPDEALAYEYEQAPGTI
jgi:hypothetical protein